MKWTSLMLVNFLLWGGVNAQEKINYAAAAQPISTDQAKAKVVMNEVYESFIKIIPFVYGKNEGKGFAENWFSDALKEKKVEGTLLLNLHNIQDSFKNARHLDFFKTPGFRPSLDSINSHLDETIQSIQTKNLTFAQSRLKAVTALCVSCHSQLSETVAKNAFGETISSESRSRFDSDYSYANYLFLVRRFTESVRYFEKSIKSAMLNEDARAEVLGSMQRILTLYTKIFFRPEKAIEFLATLEKEKKLPKIVQEKMNFWKSELKKWKEIDIWKEKDPSTFIDKYLAPIEARKENIQTGEYDVTLLVSAGFLTKFMTDHPESTKAAEILYWLSIAERRLSSTYFFSLSDLYLKDCIIKHSKEAYAQKCYKEYEENILFGYSGSSGTSVPKDEQKELDRLKSYLKLDETKKIK